MPQKRRVPRLLASVAALSGALMPQLGLSVSASASPLPNGGNDLARVRSFSNRVNALRQLIEHEKIPSESLSLRPRSGELMLADCDSPGHCYKPWNNWSSFANADEVVLGGKG